MRNRWLGPAMMTLLLTGLVAVHAIDEDPGPENVLIFNYAHRGTLYGDGPAQAQLWTGYVIIDNESGAAVALMVSGQEQQVEIWGAEPVMGYEVDAGPQSNYHIYNNGGATGMYRPAPDRAENVYSYAHAIGRIYPRAIDIGGGFTATIAPSMTGRRKIFANPATYSTAVAPTTLYFDGFLSARYNHAMTLAANGVNGVDYLNALIASLGFEEMLAPVQLASAPPPPTTCATTAQASPEILCYLLRIRDAEFGDNTTRVTNLSGIYIVDMVSGDALTLSLWREGGRWWYQTDMDLGSETISQRLQHAGGEYIFNIMPWGLTAGGAVAQDFGMMYMYGRLTPNVPIGGGILADVPGYMVGNTYEHEYLSGGIEGEGFYREGTIKATILLQHTRFFNEAGDYTLQDVLNWFIDHVVPEGAQNPENELR